MSGAGSRGESREHVARADGATVGPMIGAGVPGSGSDVPRSERLNLEALVSDLYQRHRERYVVGHLVGAYAMIVALGVLGGAVGARFSGRLRSSLHSLCRSRGRLGRAGRISS
jgi:hypothetical protein